MIKLNDRRVFELSYIVKVFYKVAANYHGLLPGKELSYEIQKAGCVA
jgi:hypothetical protein